MRLTLVTPPETEPVSLAETKQHARIDEDTDNNLVASLIVAARQLAETFTRRAFITQTWKMNLDAWPGGEVELPKAPLQSVTSVTTYDDADVATVFAASGYYVDTDTKPGRIVLRDSSTWPDVERVGNGIAIVYKAGYGDQPSDVPAAIRLAILQTIAHLYQHRGDASVMMPETAANLLMGYRIWTL